MWYLVVGRVVQVQAFKIFNVRWSFKLFKVVAGGCLEEHVPVQTFNVQHSIFKIGI